DGNSCRCDGVKGSDRRGRSVGRVDRDLGGKGGSERGIRVRRDGNSDVDLVDKEGNIIGWGRRDDRGDVRIRGRKGIGEGNVSGKGSDNGEDGNRCRCDGVKGSD
ncbi:hypothetical protein, partial [Staphylococcus haemolyticus]|uniref:hypothetical protein n=1 Tax=Staphylococcus haemolyticus TaxID=1283 RepID=UPI001643231D